MSKYSFLRWGPGPGIYRSGARGPGPGLLRPGPVRGRGGISVNIQVRVAPPPPPHSASLQTVDDEILLGGEVFSSVLHSMLNRCGSLLALILVSMSKYGSGIHEYDSGTSIAKTRTD